MSAEVFISYASQDRERILTLVNGLDSAGVSVWIDQMSIEGATMWSQEIVAAIRDCKVLILAISKNSGSSENVVKEVALASEGRKRILPVYLEQAEIPESMAYQLAGIQRVEFFKGNEEAGHQSVIRALAKLGITVSDEASITLAGVPKRTSHGISHSTTGQAPTSKGSAWMKIAAAVGGVAALAVCVFFLTGSGSETTQSLSQAETNELEQTRPLAKVVTLDTNRVVVLPFKTIGTSGETADLGYGLVSTLTSKLQPLQNLTVIANESAWSFEDSKLPPKKIGQELEVGTIVTGEIQTSGDKVQVNIRVINANTAAVGWGSTFTKTKSLFLDLQNEIATRLAAKLKGGLNEFEAKLLTRKDTENPEALARYQAGRREWNKRSKEGFDNSIKLFEKAIELDPNYADPYAGLADTYLLMVNYDYASRAESIPIAKNYSQTAMEKNPNLAAAYVSMAWLQHVFEYDWLAAEENYKKAIKLNPNYAIGSLWYGMMLRSSGRMEEGTKFVEKAAQLDPNSMIIKAILAQFYERTGKKDMSLKYAEEAIAIAPNFRTALRVKYIDLLADGIDGAINKYKNLLKTNGNNSFRYGLVELYITKDDRASALEEFSEIVADPLTTQQKNLTMFNLYNTLGKYDNAIIWLDKAIQNKEPLLSSFQSEAYDEIRKKPRFVELVKSINHPAFQD